MVDGQDLQGQNGESEAVRILAEVNPEAAEAMRDQAQHANRAGQKFQAAREESGVASLEGAETKRVFAAPQHPYGRILIRPGALVSFRDPTSPMGKRDTGREGDIYAVFRNGVCIADLTTEEGRIVAEWCEAHGPDKELHKQYHRAQGRDAATCRTKAGFCRDVTDPQVGLWSELKVLQTATASRDPAISPTRDIDSTLGGAGGRAAGSEGQAIDSGRRMVEASKEA